ncbi:hypothetical protein BDN70DRAFT_931888 [Pholiota conissans]|uniref:Uncharacterized protein n=1 Tax=Pholiota conissans TaxID=109636 RepID=A0A9P6D217_9AGAR|nr:hypothetical protein BDN70DRAFT_931888 [Pholiota conissans]
MFLRLQCAQTIFSFLSRRRLHFPAIFPIIFSYIFSLIASLVVPQSCIQYNIFSVYIIIFLVSFKKWCDHSSWPLIFWLLVEERCFELAGYHARNAQHWRDCKLELKCNLNNIAPVDLTIPTPVDHVVPNVPVDVASIFATVSSEDLWNDFLAAVTSYLEQDEGIPDIIQTLTRLKDRKPSFAPLTNKYEEALQ